MDLFIRCRIGHDPVAELFLTHQYVYSSLSPFSHSLYRVDAYSDRQDELEAERKEKYKHWNRRKDEEMRRRLLMAYRPYFPNDVFHTGSGMLHFSYQARV